MFSERNPLSSERGIITGIEWRAGAMLIALLLILALSPGLATAQDYAVCTYYSWSPTDRYVGFDSDLFLSGAQDWYTANDCADVESSFNVPGSGWVYLDGGGSEEDAIAACDAALGGRNDVLQEHSLYPSDFATFNPNVWRCVNTPARKAKASARKAKAPAPKKPKPVLTEPTGETLMKTTDLELSAVSGLDTNIEFQRVNSDGVGIQEVIDLGFLDAVDVWSNIGGGYTVCFPQIGRIVFLDAATSPRTVNFNNYSINDGFTCASMDRAGTLVLVQKSETTSLAQTVSSITTLEDCQVTASYNLNFRGAPGGEKLDAVPRDTTLDASARTRFWFMVSFNDQDGWISAAHVSAEGSCGFSPSI